VTERQEAVGIYVNSLESITREEDGNYYRRLLCVYIHIHVHAANLSRVIYACYLFWGQDIFMYFSPGPSIQVIPSCISVSLILHSGIGVRGFSAVLFFPWWFFVVYVW
jgi:hypothetical protein